MMWLGAKMSAAAVSSTDLHIRPLKRNITDGMIDSASALKMLLFLKQTAQITQYTAASTALTIRYSAIVSLDCQPKQVPGMSTIINKKQLKRPICSKISTILFFHRFSKPFLHLTANTMFGIRIITTNNKPYMFTNFIISSLPASLI